MICDDRRDDDDRSCARILHEKTDEERSNECYWMHDIVNEDRDRKFTVFTVYSRVSVCVYAISSCVRVKMRCFIVAVVEENMKFPLWMCAVGVAKNNIEIESRPIVYTLDVLPRQSFILRMNGNRVSVCAASTATSDDVIVQFTFAAHFVVEL